MTTHATEDGIKSLCGRNLNFGTNRTNELFFKGLKGFVKTYKTNKASCCTACVAEYNKRAKAQKKGK